jgi:phosphohistidine swiveling domain-containing protein
MNVATDLIHIVERAHSLERILEASARVVAERLRADACLLFLLDEHGDLVRSPAGGSDSAAENRPDAEAETLAAQAVAERRVATAHGAKASRLAAPLLLRDSMLGALVLRSAGRRDFSAEDVDGAAAVCAQLAGIVENARVIDALDRGDRPTPPALPRPASTEPGDGERILTGVGASPGVAIGDAVFRGAYRLDLSARDLPAGEPAAERERVRIAIEKTHHDVSRVQDAAAREIDEEHALIFTSHLLLLNDPMLLQLIDRKIGAGASAPAAIDAALEELETGLRLVDDAYLREKIDDLDDLRTRLLDHVLDSRRHAHLGSGVVLTSRIPPSLVIELKTAGARALITETGGATSHGLLLARALGIPVVIGIADMLPAVRPGDRLIVDGTAGIVVVRPGEDTVTRYRAKHRRAERARTEHAKYRKVPARTADGVRLTLQANVGVASDLAVARGAQRVQRLPLDPRPLRSPGRAAGAGAGVRPRGRGSSAAHPDSDGDVARRAPPHENEDRRGPRRPRRAGRSEGPRDRGDDRSAGRRRAGGRDLQGGGLPVDRHQRPGAIRAGRRPGGCANGVDERPVSPGDPAHDRPRGRRGTRRGEGGRRLRRDGGAPRPGPGADGARSRLAQRRPHRHSGAQAGARWRAVGADAPRDAADPGAFRHTLRRRRTARGPVGLTRRAPISSRGRRGGTCAKCVFIPRWCCATTELRLDERRSEEDLPGESTRQVGTRCHPDQDSYLSSTGGHVSNKPKGTLSCAYLADASSSEKSRRTF